MVSRIIPIFVLEKGIIFSNSFPSIVAKVKFTYALKRFFPGLETLEISAKNIHNILEEVEVLHPGMKGYIVDEQGRMRKHVNIYINETTITDRIGLTDEVTPTDEVFIMQALSGG